MYNVTEYNSPLGKITIACKDGAVTGLWFNDSKYFNDALNCEYVYKSDETLDKAKQWLDCYFTGEEPDFNVPLYYNSSPFRMEVWDVLKSIPFGQTMTYKEIADIIASSRGVDKMSAQAIGGAVGRNPISIMIPCHRVIGSDGSLTGYAGGINKKLKLLELEGYNK